MRKRLLLLLLMVPASVPVLAQMEADTLAIDPYQELSDADRLLWLERYAAAAASPQGSCFPPTSGVHRCYRLAARDELWMIIEPGGDFALRVRLSSGRSYAMLPRSGAERQECVPWSFGIVRIGELANPCAHFELIWLFEGQPMP